MQFLDHVCIVTGGASGIGLATARRFGSEGARVVVADLHDAPAAADVVRAAGAPDAWGATCDVADEAQVEATVQGAMARFGRLDVVVNNAGLMTFGPIESLTEDDWLHILRVDLLGAFFFIKHAFRTMKPGSAVVNVSSVHAVETTPLVAPYAASKSALLSLTRSAALEGKSKGIRVNAVLPGAIDTPMLRNNPNVASGTERLAPEDVGKPEDIAAVIAFLASSEAAFVQGASIRVDGSRLAHL
jgi:NAD(P)-dependent dehydrogenase (short-subunit alcohol dehydrogenase family)